MPKVFAKCNYSSNPTLKQTKNSNFTSLLLINKTYKREEGFLSQSRISFSLPQRQPPNPGRHSAIIQLPTPSIPFQPNEEHASLPLETRSLTWILNTKIGLIFEHPRNCSSTIPSYKQRSPSTTESKTCSSKQIHTSIKLKSNSSWKRCGAFLTPLSRCIIGIISRSVKLNHTIEARVYKSLFNSIKSFRIVSYSVPNPYLRSRTRMSLL